MSQSFYNFYMNKDENDNSYPERGKKDKERERKIEEREGKERQKRDFV